MIFEYYDGMHFLKIHYGYEVLKNGNWIDGAPYVGLTIFEAYREHGITDVRYNDVKKELKEEKILSHII